MSTFATNTETGRRVVKNEDGTFDVLQWRSTKPLPSGLLKGDQFVKRGLSQSEALSIMNKSQ